MDLIDRQQAISIAKDLIVPDEEAHDYNQGVNNYCAKLVGLPAVQKTGKWIETNLKGMEAYYCSICEDSYYLRPIDPSWNYCPHCGARMVGEEE